MTRRSAHSQRLQRGRSTGALLAGNHGPDCPFLSAHKAPEIPVVPVRIQRNLTTHSMRNTVDAMLLRDAVACAALLFVGACASTESLGTSDLGEGGDGSAGDTTTGGGAGDATGGDTGTSGEGGWPGGTTGMGGDPGTAGDGGTAAGGTATGGTGGTETGGAGGAGGTPPVDGCTGTPTACNLLTGTDCTAVQGCSETGTCTETATALCPFWPKVTCIAFLIEPDPPCFWDGVLAQCYSPCDRAVDQATCSATLCTYTAGACSGTAVACQALTQEVACTAQLGCTWN